MVVVTDGYVGVEADAYRFIRERLQEANLFSFGIGSSVNRALIEGMACGIPFLASDVGGNRQMSETGAGWLFQSGSISSLAQRLQRIAGEHSELRRRGETGLRSLPFPFPLPLPRLAIVLVSLSLPA